MFFSSLLFLVLSISINSIVNFQGELPAFLLSVRHLIASTTINGRIFRGLFYIPIGIILSSYTFSPKISFALFGVGYAFRIYFSLSGMFGTWYVSLATAVASIGFFSFVKDIPLPDFKFYPFFRHASTTLYFLHMYAFVIYSMIVYKRFDFYGFDSFIVSSSVCLLISVISFYYKNKCKTKSVRTKGTALHNH